MFNKRLFIFMLLVGCAAAAVVVRLAQMQLVHGGAYAHQAEESLKVTRWLATHRGEILDRRGRILAVDQPCFEFTLRYEALLTSWAQRQARQLMDQQGVSADEAQESVGQQLEAAQERLLRDHWLTQQARAIVHRQWPELTGRARDQRRAEVLAGLPERIDWTLNRAAETVGIGRAELDEEIDRIVQHIWRVRAIVKMRVAEEESPHGIIHALDEVTSVALLSQLSDMLGADVAPSTRRWYPCGPTASHVIGLMGRVASQDVGSLWRPPPGPTPATRPGPTPAVAPRFSSAGALADLPPETDANNGGQAEGTAVQAPQPSWPSFAQIAGFSRVEARSENQAGHEQDMLREYLPDELAGVTGIERMAEPVLRGIRGRQVHHRSGALVEQTAAVGGQDVHVTLDIELQQVIEREILDGRPENGAAVVIHIPTGQVLALASKPRYDLNEYRVKFNALVADQTNLPLLHRAVACSYPPGSTVKPLVALAAAAEGVLTPQQTIECRGYLFPSSPDKFRCWIYKEHSGQHGPQTMREALRHSCNIYFYTAGEKLGNPALMDWLRRFGMGEHPGTLLPEEKAGRVPSGRWMWQNQSHPLRLEDLCLMGIGQGKLEATPLQVANGMATVARGGLYKAPLLVLSGSEEAMPDSSRQRDLKLPADAVAAVQAGMSDVVNHSDGTAHNYAYDPDLPELCGKTGTAQAAPRRLSGDMAWFAGYAPRHNPQIAFAILVEYVSAGSGGSVCGPMAKQLVRACRDKGYLP
jgi:penicillin-binding protein 2